MRYAIVMILLLVVSSAADAATLRVPEDYSTINAAIDVAASGDSILVGPGTWTSETRSLTVCTNFLTRRSVMFLKPGLTIVGTAGPALTILDGGDGPSPPIETVLMTDADGPPVRVQGFTITGEGGGVLHGCTDTRLELVNCHVSNVGTRGINSDGTLVLEDCVVSDNGSLSDSPLHPAVRVDGIGHSFEAVRTRFEDNRLGGVVASGLDSFVLEDCEFVDHKGSRALSVSDCSDVAIRGSLFLRNAAGGSGGGLTVTRSDATVEFCTFAYDSSRGSNGGAIDLRAGTTTTAANNTFYRCHVPVSSIGSAILVNGGTLTAYGNVAVECERAFAAPVATVTLDSGCNLFWGNTENYSFWPEEATLTDIVADPEFCNPGLLDFTVRDSSPASSANSGGCGQIGAHGVGCGSVSIKPTTWGRIKNSYRE